MVLGCVFEDRKAWSEWRTALKFSVVSAMPTKKIDGQNFKLMLGYGIHGVFRDNHVSVEG